MARKRKRRRKQVGHKPIQPTPVKRRFSTVALTVVMIVSLGLGAWFALSPTLEKEQARSEQQHILAEYEARDTQPEPTASVPPIPDPTPTPVPEPLVVFETVSEPAPEPTPRPIPENSGDRAIGALEVERIGLKLPVVEGIDKAQLDVAIGHIPETAPVGEVGNAVLAGHRSYAYGKFFNRLGEVEVGDELTYTDAEGKSYKFSVYEVLELLPDDQSAFEPYTEKSVLSLYTCTPSARQHTALWCAPCERNKEGGYLLTDNCFHCVSLSGGKDSTATLLLMIERGMPIDMVLCADTTMEFPEMYTHLEKVDAHLFRERGLHITTLRHPQGFEYLMFEQPKQRAACIENRQRLGIPLCGNGWPGMKVRWCTGQLKTHLISKEINRLKGERRVLNYIGIAADETQRCKKDQYPLAEWGMTEAEALKACYDRGFDFGGLYEIYRRCSCWCCPFQRIGELKKLRQHHPELWARLLDMDNRARAMFGPGPLGQFKKDWSVERLEERFAREDEQQENDRRACI